MVPRPLEHIEIISRFRSIQRGLEALIAQFSNELKMNEDSESNNEEEVPEGTPQTTSSVTISNVTNIEPEVEPEHIEDLEELEDTVPLPNLGSISPPQSIDEEEKEEEKENYDDDSIKLTVSKEEAIQFVKNNFRVITRFLQSEECKYLKRETSFAEGSVGSFLIGAGISEELNEAIKETINKMDKVNKCFNLISKNAHAAYVYTVIKMFK